MIAQTEAMNLLQQIDNDILGFVLILSTIGIFIISIVSIVAVFRTFNNVLLTRMNHSMVKSLLAKGYTIDEVERLTYGNQNWGRKIRNAVRSATTKHNRFKNRFPDGTQPAPPVKQSV